jgi:hypothetical protein
MHFNELIHNVNNISAHRRTLIIEAIPITNPTNILTTNYASYTMSFATVTETPIGSAAVLKEESDTICALCL